MTVSPARPSLDDRFALGLCSSCSRDSGQADELDPMKVQQLVRADAWDPKVLEGQRRRRNERRILRSAREDEQQERARILERYRAEVRERGMPA